MDNYKQYSKLRKKLCKKLRKKFRKKLCPYKLRPHKLRLHKLRLYKLRLDKLHPHKLCLYKIRPASKLDKNLCSKNLRGNLHKRLSTKRSLALEGILVMDSHK